MKRGFFVFFIEMAACVALLFSPRALRAETLSGGITVSFPRVEGSEHRAELLGLLGGIDTEVGKLLYAAPGGAIPAAIEVSAAPIEGEFQLVRRGSLAVLRVGVDYDKFMNTRRARRVFAIFMMLAKCGIAPESGFARFPVWIADGLLRRLEGLERTRNQLRMTVGYYPGIRAVLLKRGGFPLREVLGEASTLHEAGGAAAEFGDQASLMAVELCRDRAVISLSPAASGPGDAAVVKPARISGLCPAARMIVASCSGEDFDQAFLRAFSTMFDPPPGNLEALDAALSAAIERRVFSQFAPYPALEQLRRVEKFSTFTYFDNEGKRHDAEITDLPLLIGHNDSCRFVYNSKARELSSLLNGAGPLTYSELDELLRAFSMIGAIPPEESRTQLKEKLAAVRAAVDRFAALGGRLDAAEAEIVPMSEQYKLSFDSLSGEDAALPPQFVDALKKADE